MSETEPNNPAPWYVRFFKRDYLRIYGHTLQPDRTDTEAQFAIHALDMQPHHRVLDLCCGQGRHSIALARAGLDVSGVDLSSEMLDIAQISAEASSVKLELHRADMRQLPSELAGRFDAVINMFSSFGYLESEADDQQVLIEAAKVLKPGGKLMMDLLNREWVIINNEEYDWQQHEDGRVVLERRQLDLATSTNHLTYTEILPDGTRRVMSDLYMRLYSLTEMIKMLNKAGLTLARAYGGFQGEEYGVNTRRMILVASKEASAR